MSKQFKNWIQKGLDKGLEDVEIYAVDKTDLSLEVYDGRIEQNEISVMNTAIIKGIYNNKIAKVKVENLSDENINFMLDKLIESAKNITANEPAIIFEGSKSYQEVIEENFDFSNIDPVQKVDFLLDIEKAIKEHELVTNVQTISYSEIDSKTTIVNSKGLNLTRHHTYAMVYAIGVFEKDSQIKTGMDYQIVRDYHQFDVKNLVNGVIENGVKQLGANPISSGKYPVIFSNEMFSNILSAFSSIFTGEAAFRGLTKLVGQQGNKIANGIVNLIDDPFKEEALFKVPFDDEGVAANKRYWIKDGLFTDFAHNLKTAEIFKTKSTGNGYTSGIRPSNLYLEPQNNSLDAVIKTIDNGLYITDLVGLHAGVETVSGDFSLQAAGFKIVDGIIKDAVDMIVVSGNFFNLLKDIEMIANDFKFGLSGIGSGSVKVRELTIGGK